MWGWILGQDLENRLWLHPEQRLYDPGRPSSDESVEDPCVSACDRDAGDILIRYCL